MNEMSRVRHLVLLPSITRSTDLAQTQLQRGSKEERSVPTDGKGGPSNSWRDTMPLLSTSAFAETRHTKTHQEPFKTAIPTIQSITSLTSLMGLSLSEELHEDFGDHRLPFLLPRCNYRDLWSPMKMHMETVRSMVEALQVPRMSKELR